MIIPDDEFSACDLDDLAPLHQWAACRVLWTEALRRYLFDCKMFWNRPMGIHEQGVEQAYADLTGSMRMLTRICDHLGDDAHPETIRRYFYEWTKEHIE